MRKYLLPGYVDRIYIANIFASLALRVKRTNTGGYLYYTIVNSTKYGVCSFKYQRIQILNNSRKSKKKFAKDLKSYFYWNIDNVMFCKWAYTI